MNRVNNKRSIIICLWTLLALISCSTSRDKNHVQRDIPISEYDENDIFYSITKSRVDSLNLDKIEDGYDSIQIRLWYDYQLLRLKKLLVITRSENKWRAYSYKLLVDPIWDTLNGYSVINKGEKVRLVASKEVYPKNGWSKFTGLLFGLKVTTLPHMATIPGLEDNWTDGVCYYVEVATEDTYRFYSYHLPDKFQEYWQARNMLKILELIQDEFDIRIDFDLKAEPIPLEWLMPSA